MSRIAGWLAVLCALCLAGCDTGGVVYPVKEGLRLKQASLDAVPGWSPARTATGTVYLAPDIVLGSRDIEYVQDAGCSAGACYIDLRFTANGARRMSRFSAAHLGRYLAIVVDGKVVSVAYITAPMSDGLQETVSSRQEAEALLHQVALGTAGSAGKG